MSQASVSHRRFFAPAARQAVLAVRVLVVRTITVAPPVVTVIASTIIGGVTVHAPPDAGFALVTAQFLAAHRTSSALVCCRAQGGSLAPIDLRVASVG